MELSLILLFTFLVVVFVILTLNSDFTSKFYKMVGQLGKTSLFTTIKEILLFPILYLIPMLFVVIVLIIAIVYMIVNDIKYEKVKTPKDMRIDKHTVTLNEGKTLSERFTDIERDFNIKHYKKICSGTPLNERKEFCMLFAKKDCNSIGC